MAQHHMTSNEGTMMEQKKRLSFRTKLLIALPFIVALVIFGYWTISPLFIDTVVNERLTTDGLTILSQGSFIGADDVLHKAEGSAKLLSAREKEVLIRFEEDFKVSNGPDLYVWLVKQGTDYKTNYVDLGRLKGNIGSQNYIVPAGVNLHDYDSVIIWCKAFSVLFGTAKLISL